MIGVVIVVGLVLVYALGRSDGKDKVKSDIRKFFTNDRRKGRK